MYAKAKGSFILASEHITYYTQLMKQLESSPADFPATNTFTFYLLSIFIRHHFLHVGFQLCKVIMAIRLPKLSASSYAFLCPFLLLAVFLTPASAFGAGNIAAVSAIEGQNWRHGDIEDTLLNILLSRAAGGKKFSKLDVKRVYFGNWLRDYSQAVDVGTVKYVSAEAIRLILWVLGFMSFGYGTKEFEVTTERLGCYRPEGMKRNNLLPLEPCIYMF